MQLEFGKYEGAGNDFILIDTRTSGFVPERNLVAKLCDRHFGIGADGLMTLSASPTLDCTMRYYNADGTQGEMCGNGGRCFALFAHHLGIGDTTLRFDALDGEHEAHLLSSDECCGEVELGMIDVTKIEKITLADGTQGWSLNTGVPHYVEFTDDLRRIDVIGRGCGIRHDLTRFPEGTNVNFVEVIGPGSIRVRTYERGVENETLACGTGATAAAIVTNHIRQQSMCHFDVTVPGGHLGITFEIEGTKYHTIRLSGNAHRVFNGRIETENLIIK